MASVVAGILAFVLVLSGALRLRRLPASRACAACPEPTLPIRTGAADRAARLLGLQRRWCPSCGWSGLRRRRPAPSPDDPPAAHASGFRWARPRPGAAPVFRWGDEGRDRPPAFRWRREEARG